MAKGLNTHRPLLQTDTGATGARDPPGCRTREKTLKGWGPGLLGPTKLHKQGCHLLPLEPAALTTVTESTRELTSQGRLPFRSTCSSSVPPPPPGQSSGRGQNLLQGLRFCDPRKVGQEEQAKVAGPACLVLQPLSGVSRPRKPPFSPRSSFGDKEPAPRKGPLTAAEEGFGVPGMCPAWGTGVTAGLTHFPLGGSGCDRHMDPGPRLGQSGHGSFRGLSSTRADAAWTRAPHTGQPCPHRTLNERDAGTSRTQPLTPEPRGGGREAAPGAQPQRLPGHAGL